MFFATLIKDEASSLKAVEYLITVCHLDCTLSDELNQTSLFYAAREGKPRVTEYLLKAGCKVDHVD